MPVLLRERRRVAMERGPRNPPGTTFGSPLPKDAVRHRPVQTAEQRELDALREFEISVRAACSAEGSGGALERYLRIAAAVDDLDRKRA